VTRWQPSSIRQLPLYCNRRYGFRRGRNSNAVPSSDSIPASPCPRVSAALLLSIGKAARLSSLSQSNSGPISRVCGPDHQNTLTSAYYSDIPINMLTENQILWAQVQRYSLRLVFLPHIRFTAKSRAPVGSSCQSRLCSSARRITPKSRRARFRALRLRSAPGIDSASLRSFPRQL
jgi:hypothetical protein